LRQAPIAATKRTATKPSRARLIFPIYHPARRFVVFVGLGISRGRTKTAQDEARYEVHRPEEREAEQRCEHHRRKEQIGA